MGPYPISSKHFQLKTEMFNNFLQFLIWDKISSGLSVFCFVFSVQCRNVCFIKVIKTQENTEIK